jgi:AraC-like DNA-binding protein
MSTDALSEVLRAVRLSGAAFFDVHATSPWVAETPPAREIAPHVLPGAQHVMEYHLITQGTWYGGIVGEPAVRLEPGDVIVFPQGDPHVMSSAPGMRGRPDIDQHRRPPGGQLPLMVNVGGGGKDEGRIVCGFLGCDVRPFNPLIASLPRMIPVRARPGEAWLDQLIRVAVAESAAQRAGAECMLARLSELLFVEMVRRYLETLPTEESGWLAGLRDPHVGRALALLHDRPARPWALDELASEAGLSRSSLAERFVHFVGMPPMHYLARWRMQLASNLLSSGSGSVAEIAFEVGYTSEAAFSRAFKKMVGLAPGLWREAQRS